MRGGGGGGGMILVRLQPQQGQQCAGWDRSQSLPEMCDWRWIWLHVWIPDMDRCCGSVNWVVYKGMSNAVC